MSVVELDKENPMVVLPAKIMNLCNAIKVAGGTPYITGGFVRDYIMGREAHDIDICVVGMTMDSLLAAFPEGKAVGKSFPIVVVDGVEVALARTEKKTGEGYTAFVCETNDVTLLQDLSRRDLAVNAMALDPFTNQLIDPFGGRDDIVDNILTPASESFGEDPLRVLRAARLAATLKMTIGSSLVSASRAVRHELPTLSPERIFVELQKALRSERPSAFFMALDQLGALEIVFPEIANLKGRIQPEKYHPEGDAYIHTLLVIDRARELGADDVTMFAALVHDLGKAVTDDDNLPHHYNHEALGVSLVKAFCERLRIPNEYRDAGVATSREHLNVHRFLDLKPITKARFLERLGAVHGNELLERVGLASQADAQGRGPLFHDKPYPQRQAMLDAAEKFRTVKGDAFTHLNGEAIKQKLEQARAKVLK